MPRNHEKGKNNKVNPVSTHLKEKEEKIIQILERLAEESAKGIPIIVEGKKDTDTLRTLGIEGSIITAKSGGKSLLDVVLEAEKKAAPEIILLLDFDRRGKEWTKRLTQHFEKTGMKSNLTFWKELFGIVRREVKDVEGLVAYMKTLKEKTGNRNEDSR
jgi:2,5-diamino-6-(ribosylamino)-4(3H)-pyrimidinone 5'-phosphate reductase